ncbi:TonB-dependent receptor [Simiduia sp. 21SJ11W-1]|uniref:TonB-dependent receptor n=1 Tax=Simiduia sp. 21SJ11W-1 TaxID=2909669 RepID=UPI00209EEDE2|nr:TonB-dependent receptor [Simiduia sp. 21SJ11W-1]UTA48404.1 TonB-dependent receptor [Simiduia sp. 21SJ11W-1]
MSKQRSAFMTNRLAEATRATWRSPFATLSTAVLAGAMLCSPAYAQLAGAIKGSVAFEEAGTSPAGVKVTATSSKMPKARTAVTDESGSYSLPMLVPGEYLLTFEAADGTVRTASTEVRLEQTTRVDMVLDSTLDASEMEEVFVTGRIVNLESNSSLSNSIGADMVDGVPVGQDYRDLMKLIPGVQYTQETVRGPSAGASGQDNVYNFDGVDVGLPGYGVLSSEPATHDVEQMAVQRGGANAINFNRAGGVSVNTTSKSGSNEFAGSVQYKFQTPSMVGETRNGVKSETTRSWLTANVSGPLIEDQLFFYGSFYRPYAELDNKDTAYGPVKSYSSDRHEYYGKLTYAPIEDILLNASYRTSDKKIEGNSIGFYEPDSVSAGSETSMDILNLDGTWIIDGNTTLSVAYSDYDNDGGTTADTQLSVQPVLGGSLDIDNIHEMGYVNVPSYRDEDTPEDIAYNDFIRPYVEQYGFINEDGERQGGGGVGAYFQNEVVNYHRKTFTAKLDHTLTWGDATHELHAGYKYTEGGEILDRNANGWGSISIIGGRSTTDDGVPVYFQTRTPSSAFNSSGNVLDTYTKEHNIEFNDLITYGDFMINVGVLLSQDTLYGQGLKEDSSSPVGFIESPGTNYEMYNVPFSKMIQPRLGITWQYAGEGTVFANYAAYNPAASSLARAASWDRNRTQLLQEVRFDADGNYIESEPQGSSSGKFFVKGMDPRKIDEFTLGTTREVTDELSIRAHLRYREGSNFWEDVPNDARLSDDAPQHIQDKGLYLPELPDLIDGVGSGSSYVIATLDEAYTKYYEGSIEAEWNGDRFHVNASYVYSRYRGNFDQDNSSGANDQAIYIGSSNIADGVGRQTWDNRDGILRGDRPHQFKTYGYYKTDWNANIGAYLIYQSGQPWEAWDAEAFGLPSWYSSTSRYAEKAGSNRSKSHWQLDLNYTQNFEVYKGTMVNFRADLFNVFDRQTGYNINPYVSSSTFGEPRNYFASRRLQLSLGVNF